jgi:hypothetical protein
MFAVFKNNEFVKVVPYEELFNFLNNPEYFAYVIKNVLSNHNNYIYNLHKGNLIITKKSFFYKITHKIFKLFKN